MLRRALITLIATVASIGSMRAVILYGTDTAANPTANTTAPTGSLANSGWQYEGQFGSFLGTVIASNYFVTAKHIGGSVGDTFRFNNVTYTTTAVFPDPSSDLQVWQVSGTFPIHAPLYASAPGSEANLSLVVFGRGTQRGGPVFVGNDSHTGGWLWGSSDEVQRWGTNVVGEIVNDSNFGPLVRAPFDNNAGPNEAHLSAGDSGGAVFVFNPATSQWELAGINLGVDGSFSTSSSGTNPFNAAMFDTTGLFVQSGSIPWDPAPNPSAFYSTEIAAHRRFVESVVMQLTDVVSRKVHPNAGTFDIELPSSGRPGIECRSGGTTNSHTLVFTFTNNVSVQNATITAGAGSVTNFVVVGNVVTVNLTGVTNAQTITVTLSNVSDGTNMSDVEAAMGVLTGRYESRQICRLDRYQSDEIAIRKAGNGCKLSGRRQRRWVHRRGGCCVSEIEIRNRVAGRQCNITPNAAGQKSIRCRFQPTERTGHADSGLINFVTINEAFSSVHTHCSCCCCDGHLRSIALPVQTGTHRRRNCREWNAEFEARACSRRSRRAGDSRRIRRFSMPILCYDDAASDWPHGEEFRGAIARHLLAFPASKSQTWTRSRDCSRGCFSPGKILGNARPAF